MVPLRTSLQLLPLCCIPCPHIEYTYQLVFRRVQSVEDILFKVRRGGAICDGQEQGFQSWNLLHPVRDVMVAGAQERGGAQQS